MAQIATQKIERLASQALELGVPRDQLETFLQAGYVPQLTQMKFHAAANLCDFDDGPSYIGYGGTRGQAKSHAILAQAVIDDMACVDGLKYLYLRKIQKKALESFDDLRRKVLQLVPHEYKNSTLTLPNGSFMVMGGFRSESEIDSYLGLEYDGIVAEDVTTLSESKHTAIMGALRTSRTDWRPRMYESANPGGVGHAWFRRMYYDPWRRGQETSTRFVHTKMGDNVFINQGYSDYLDSLTGWLRRAWRDGDFEISAGQFFDNWSYDRIVIEPFKPPYGWMYWLAMDWGYTHWCVVYLLGMGSDNEIYVIDEHAERRWQVPQHAEAIHGMLTRHGMEYSWIREFIAGSDAFASKDDTGKSIADKFAAQRMVLTPANMDRISGAAELLHRLGREGQPPTLRIFENCHRLIECIPLMEHDPRRPEDVLKVNADDTTGEGGDDPYDAVRYGIMAAGTPSIWVGPSPTSGWRG